MDTIDVFSSKAEKYARYRWDYAPEAVQAIFDVTRISRRSSVADIGAGTGILTRHLVGKVEQVFAIEPNAFMRQLAVAELGFHPSCHIIDGRAEATTLPDHSVDLVTVAQAIGWFEPRRTKAEFLRILKPGGWLAALRNYGTDDELGEALEKVFPQEGDKSALKKGRGTPIGFYYGGNDYQKQTFAFTTQRTWDEFIGTLCTASYAPDEESPLYVAFGRAARKVFDRFSSGGVVASHAVTELCVGQITEP